jgi:hypothetical protein
MQTAAAIGLGVWLIALASPSSGADPHVDPRPLSAVSEVDATPAPDVTDSPIPGTRADVKRARVEAEAAATALVEARLAHDRAVADEADALAVEVAAQEAMLASRVRLGDLIAAEDTALTARTRAAARVLTAAPGSKSHRSAFIEWQMAAVAERAAHARRTIAEEDTARLFVALQPVEARLAETEIALTDARAARRKAERAAAAAATVLRESEAATSAGPSHAPTTPPSPGSAVAPRSPVRGDP